MQGAEERAAEAYSSYVEATSDEGNAAGEPLSLSRRTLFREFEVIERIRRRLSEISSPAFVVVGVGDDAAVLRPEPGRDLVVTCDTVIEGRHFDVRYASPADIGYRAMAVNVSDVAAMGGEPRWAVVALELREGIDDAFIEALYDGVVEAAREYRFVVVGGNVVGGVTRFGVAVTMGGEVAVGSAWRRDGARVGDGVYVTGEVGGAALGLKALSVGFDGENVAAWAARYRRPVARLEESRALVRTGCVSACVDVSDGLVQDLGHIARASNVGIELRADAIPKAPGYDDGAERFFAGRWDAALAGGDDYELAFTACARPPVGTRIGEVVRDAGVRIIDGTGAEVAVSGAGGFDHGGVAR